MKTPIIPKCRSRPPARFTALALVMIAAIVFGIGSLDSDPAPLPGDSLWGIVFTGKVDVAKANTLVRIAPPFDTPQVQLVSQTIELSGLRLRRLAGSGADRNLVFVASESGEKGARIEFEVHQRALPWPRAPIVARTLPTKLRERLLLPESGVESDATVVQELAQRLALTRPETTPAVEHIVT
ncbi:MAG: hypothetical protein ACI8W7_003018 [Gammaproteobacteria bacterium]|jgi:hypothetical protein